MTHPIRWGLALLLVLLVCFIARLPAALVARALPAKLSLASVQGSIWHGSASALGIDGMVAQEKLVWDLQPTQLLRGTLVWQLRSEHAGQPGSATLRLGLRQRELADVRLSLPLEPLTRFNPTIAGVRLGGVVHLESPRLARNAPLNASLRLERVSSAMAAEPTLLGSYQLGIEADAAGAGKLQASSLGGPLAIDGGGEFRLASQAIDLKLRLKPEGDLPGLASLLATLPREGDAFMVSFKRP